MTRVKNDAEARSKFVGRTIVKVSLGPVYPSEDDEDPEQVQHPWFLLDDGTVISFDVDDYGSNTYGINIKTNHPYTKMLAK